MLSEGLAGGNRSGLRNLHIAGLVVLVPWVTRRLRGIFRIIWLLSSGGLVTYVFTLVLLIAAIGYRTLSGTKSTYGQQGKKGVYLPNKNIEEYITVKDHALKTSYHGTKRMPMQVFHDAYFDGKIELNGDLLEVLEQRRDWAKMTFTFDLFKPILARFIPAVNLHSQSTDQEQIRGLFDRGDDFYEWFLGPRMIFTSGVVLNPTQEESLEQLQDNQLAIICEKLDLKPEDRLLDIGCGWGTLATFAAKNYDCDVTGITLSQNQVKFATERISANGVASDKARILCMDYHEIPGRLGKYTKIVYLETVEHGGVRNYSAFMRTVYELLDDNGIFVLQVSGIRPQWQKEELIWGLFKNKYISPDDGDSLSLDWIIKEVEAAGFEVKNLDALGGHYSETIHRWYKNWVSNKEKVIAKYGDRWYRIWVFFLAYSVIISRSQGSGSVFQITMHKHMESYRHIEDVSKHASIHVFPGKELSPVE